MNSFHSPSSLLVSAQPLLSAPPDCTRFHFQRITSTNDYAKTLLQEYVCVAVTADEQTAGRGRHHRVWTGANGANVYCSFGIKHSQPFPVEHLPVLQGLGCLSALYALRKAAPTQEFFLKYPNDVYVVQTHDEYGPMYKKICGVLVENDFMGAHCMTSIIGIGINVLQSQFPDDVAHKATSLALLGIAADPFGISEVVVAYLCEHYTLPPTTIMRVWQNELLSRKHVYIRTDDPDRIHYTAVELLPTGHIILQSADGHTITVSQGDSLLIG
jgi:BirA family transcriptional regulator, biotin operon repressor / biotin---[acetyl-CoA-carboxylase] ligase